MSIEHSEGSSLNYANKGDATLPEGTSFLKEHQGKLPLSEIRARLMDKFEGNILTLHPVLVENRAKENMLRQRPLVTVVASLWEEDYSMLTSKMFRESVTNLRSQASSSDMDLDFLVVANNGGGRTQELGKTMVSSLDEIFRDSFGEDAYQEIATSLPTEAPSPSIPWTTNVPLSDARTEGQDRCFFVVQPHHKLNQGKIRGLRDISHGLSDAILAGYAPDAVFQMDAETVLEYKPTGYTFTKPPFRAMFDALKRRDGVVAIGTKDRFEPIDPDTGKPLGVPMPFAHEAMTQINTGGKERFISLPGGAILIEPDYYAAGMNAISEVTYGDVAEDYLLTQMLREHAKATSSDDPVRVNSVGIITHLNRCPQGKNATRQLLRWKRQGNAVDQLFPDSKYEYKSLNEYTSLAIKARLKTLRDIKDKRRFLAQIVKDVGSIPGMLKIYRENGVADLVGGESSWTHK